MKIAIVTETFLPSTDGIVTRLTKAIDYFMREGHEVLVIAPDLGVHDYKGAKVVGIKPVTFPFYRYRKWGFPSRRVYHILKDFEPDVVHAVNPVLLATSAVKAAQKLNIPLVSSYHTHLPKYLDYYTIYKPAKPLLWWYIRRNHKNADVNLVTSKAIRDELDAEGIKRLDIIPRGVDVINRHPDFRDDAMRYRLTGGKPENKLLVFIGRLAVEKEIHKIIPLLEARDDISLAIIGDGPARSGIEKKFEATNTIFTGFMHGEELSKAFASGDAFIFPSVSETLGLVILESMASGLPLIAAKSGPTNEQVTDGVNGMLYENEDLDSMIRAVEILEDKEKLDEMKRNAREEAMGYAWDKTSQRLIDFYMDARDRHSTGDKKA
ncbi:glycosyltransferase family 4 protein [Salinicoccus halodurans]|uniref:Glycosyl transferase n=1 Tax=Salinicoccus halodurans TaxID=407035 RepID=A0A0F7D3U0_9STAP|nr:glycosyltransferase family 1 protein [Salinicoccus halodurans]AKG73070.1 glycosyl transferase [Salinicoccus halodurans]SFK78451.1 Glycosyltransferase involved in cell wall bisynthesis [Salinicoccus halodurans]